MHICSCIQLTSKISLVNYFSLNKVMSTEMLPLLLETGDCLGPTEGYPTLTAASFTFYFTPLLQAREEQGPTCLMHCGPSHAALVVQYQSGSTSGKFLCSEAYFCAC